MKRFASILGVILLGSQLLRAGYLDDIGFTALELELAALSISMPTGTGVSVSQIEADGDGVPGSPFAYMPDTTLPQFAADSITNVTGSFSTVSPHASTVGGLIYGSNSIASGVNTVGVYEANSWLGTGFLRPGILQAPLVESRDIQNHSWVGTLGTATADVIRLNRLDYAIERDDFVAVVGVNNGIGQERNLLASAYNVISVGVSSGNHSFGNTTVNGVGRALPHLVVPVGTTSDATAVVSSASTLLIETARAMSSANAEKSETIKAVLLAGTTRTGLSGWSNSSSVPLMIFMVRVSSTFRAVITS
ncbi:MAG: hypothetical protein HC904_14315 [Blastochloris sp.]|nr:hypothetical protein [Blastochloris sp.]